MAYTTINKSTDYFNTKLYTGNGAAARAITGVGFQPDFTWVKDTSVGYNHVLWDVVRTSKAALYTNASDAEDTSTSRTLVSFDSDGFTLPNVTGDIVNDSGTGYVNWNWKANGAGSANTVGSINSTVSVNTTNGFSIVKWTGNSTAGQTVGHGLGVTPKVVIIKRLNGAAQSWICKFPTATDGYLALDTTDAISASSGWLPVSNSLITLANNWSAYNNNGNDYIAYCFADVQGFSKMGSYTGNGNADGTFVYTGFKPAFVMMKATSVAQSWQMVDNKRDTFNAVDHRLRPNESGAESTSPEWIDFCSNGFKLRNNDVAWNGSGNTYIYMAFAEAPLVGTNGVTAKAR